MKISPINEKLAEICEKQFSQIGYTKSRGYFEACLIRQTEEELVIYFTKHLE